MHRKAIAMEHIAKKDIFEEQDLRRCLKVRAETTVPRNQPMPPGIDGEKTKKTEEKNAKCRA